ncbi:hypothetical protein [Actinomadura gamaensis]|uniref:Secreted protein n=1 Tax=Actinomadura gamaensis TaxID=1763541 RepID=A0ABV9U0Q7_9ACTN
MHHPLKATLVATAALATTVTTAAVPADAATHAWRVTQTFKPAARTQMDALTIASRKDGWAFGNAYHPNAKPAIVPFAYRWNGSRWKYIALPKGLDGMVQDVSVRSATDAWAVSTPGESPGAGPNAVLHWNGKRWSVVKRDLPGYPDSVQALGPKNVWVFGAPGADRGSGTWHYDGRSWKRVKTGTFMPGRTSATSSTNLWAAGRDAAPGKDMKTVGRFDGRKWTILSVGVPVWSLVAESSRSVWATGCQYGAKHPNSLLHWDGRSWKRTAAPGGECLREITPDGSGGFWFASQDGRQRGVLIHRTKAGKWSTVQVPGPKGSPFVRALARVPGTSVVWGVSTMDILDPSKARPSSIGQLLRYS